jgi:ABC transporter substrate binding protein
VPIYEVRHLNLRGALSPLFYQYRSLGIFDVWTNDLLRKYAISTIQSPNLILALLALCAVPFLVSAIMRAMESVDTLRQQQTQIKPIAFLIWMILVTEGAAFIYVLMGGYGPNLRGSYIIMPMIIMSAAAAIWLIWGSQRTRTFWPRGSSVAISAICIFGCLTSLLVMSIHQMEMNVNTPDPVGAGFVASLARPGGNTTGFSAFEYGLSGKWLELLKEVAPNLKRVAVLRDPSLAAGIGQFAAMQALAPPSLGAELSPIDSRDPSEIEAAIATFASEQNGGLIITGSQSALTHRNLIISLALRYRLPNVYGF